MDIAKAINPNKTIKLIGIRPGEKINETMINQDDSEYTYSYNNFYKILPSIHNWHLNKKRIKNGKKVNPGFVYSSNENKHWMSKIEIKKWIVKNFKNNF